MAFHILHSDTADVDALAEALRAVKRRVRFCDTCGNVAEDATCVICKDERRDRAMICVVEEPKDVLAVERTREYRGQSGRASCREREWGAEGVREGHEEG